MRKLLAALVIGWGMAFAIFAPSPSRADAPGAGAEGLVAPDYVPGWDISWPQCGKAYPPGPVDFAVIGLNNGRPFTTNPCFRHQYDWASRVEKRPAVYINTAFPKPGMPEAMTGPWGACAQDDGWCRGYNYGYAMAKDSLSIAQSFGVSPSMWWLDVEGGNYWESDGYNNSQVVRAAVDFFRERGLPVGIYGTPFQWRNITWNWQSPGIPIWTAGAQGVEMAASRCTPAYAFAGGVVVMVQYYDWGFDTNYICPGTEAFFAHPEEHPILNGPRGRTAAQAGTVLPLWHVVPMLSN